MELRRYWEIIWSRKWILIQAVGLIAGVGLLASILMPTLYGVSSQVLVNIENEQPQYFSQGVISQLPRTSGALSYVETRNVIDTYISLAKVSPVISRVIDDMNLRDRHGKPIDFDKFVITIPRIPRLLLQQKKGVRIKRLKAAEILEITGYSTDREEAMRIANGVSRSLLTFLSQLHRKEASSARQSIAKILPRIQEEKRQAEEAEEKFRIRESTVSLDNQITTVISELSVLKAEQNSTQRGLREARSNLDAIKATLEIHSESHRDGAILGNSSNLTNYKDQLISLEMKRAGSLTELTPDHPEILSIEKQIQTVKKSIKDEISRTFDMEMTNYYSQLIEKYVSNEINVTSLTARAKVLSEQIDRKQKELSELPTKAKELLRLTEKNGYYRELDLYLKTRLEYAKVAETMDIPNAVIVQPAILSVYPSNNIFFPKKSLIGVLSLLLGTLFGIFLCFLLDYLDDRIKTIQDVNEKLHQTVLGVIPRGKGDLSDLYEPFWNLRSNIKMAVLDHPFQLVSITSTVRGEGKTTILQHLSSTFAESGQKVLLMDLNLRRPVLHKMFYLSNSVGLSSFLEGGKEIEDIILPTDVDRLYLMPAGPKVSNPLRTIDSPNMQRLLQEVKKRYDVIFLDTPAIKDGSEGPILSMFSDQVILVIASGRGSENDLKRTIGILQNTQTNLLGVILNRGAR
jgi:polysaccharide biosynthesis transport protein